MKKNRLWAIGMGLLFTNFIFAQTTLIQEDLETDDEGVNYRSNTHNDLANDVWTRWNMSVFSGGPNTNFNLDFSGQEGNYAWGGEDPDSSENPLGFGANGYFILKTIDVSSYRNTNLNVKILLGANTANWESLDFFKIEYAFDSDIANGANSVNDLPELANINTGTYTTFVAYYGDPSSFNLTRDTNLDGFSDFGADALNLTLADKDFSLTIPTSATNLSIRSDDRYF